MTVFIIVLALLLVLEVTLVSGAPYDRTTMRGELSNPVVMELLEAHIQGETGYNKINLNSSLMDAYPKQKLAYLIGLHRNMNKDKNQGLILSMIGDSTMRNQFLVLCDLISSDPSDSHKYLTKYQQMNCSGTAYGFAKVNLQWIGNTGTYTNASEIADALVNREDFIRVTYYASSALHAMQLLPYRRFKGIEASARTLGSMIQSTSRILRAKHSCPIFMTMHSICDELYTGSYGNVVHDTNFTENNGRNCENDDSVINATLCAEFSFTREGSRRVHVIEIDAVKTISESPPGIVDTFDITDNQCWASVLSDGRHYIPLIPLELQILSDRIKDCIEGDEGQMNESIN